MTDTIRCPNCNHEIEVSTVLAAQLRESVRKEFDALARRKDEDVARRELELVQRERALETFRESLDQQVAERLAQQKPILMQEAETKARAAMALEVKDLAEQLQDANDKVTTAQQTELQLRKDRRELEEEKQALELKVARTLDQERATIRDQAKQEADEQHRLHEAENEQLIGGLREQIAELKRCSEKGSPQVRGEILELELEDMLRYSFPLDGVEPVRVGVHGGDVVQRVHDNTGLDCGCVLWESKRTKNWNDAWLAKLRNDQRVAKAQFAVLMSEELPKGLVNFGCIEGVWVTSRQCLVPLAAALRQGMIETARMGRSLQGRQDKAQLVHNYLAGSEFRQRIEALVEAFIALKDDLESEKRSVQRWWAKRQKQLDRGVENIASLYGDLSGLLGSSLAQVPCLEPPVASAEERLLALEPVGAASEESPF